jgi:hypothetical protein
MRTGGGGYSYDAEKRTMITILLKSTVISRKVVVKMCWEKQCDEEWWKLIVEIDKVLNNETMVTK